MWKKVIKDLGITIPKKYLDWLTKPYKLGDALRQVCQQLTVNVLEQRFRPSYQDECLLIRAKEELNITECFVREVFLEGDSLPFVFARVVIPSYVYERYISDFSQLGERLIGETMLYSNHKTLRGAFEYAGIKKNHPLYQAITAYLPDTIEKMETYWARRSVFYLDGCYPILITEAFTSVIPDMAQGY